MNAHAEDDPYAEADARVEADTRLLLHLVLGTGMVVLAFVGWLATL